MSLNKVLIIAKREYLTTVRRKAFVVTLLLTPAIFFIAGVVSARLQISAAVAKAAEGRIVAVVDSTGTRRSPSTTPPRSCRRWTLARRKSQRRRRSTCRSSCASTPTRRSRSIRSRPAT